MEGRTPQVIRGIGVADHGLGAHYDCPQRGTNAQGEGGGR